jgi:Tol biopolymer transport system component
VPEWSADSRRLAYGLKTGLVAVSDAATAKRVWTRAGLAGTWSRDGRLAVEENSFTIVVYDAAGRRLARFEGDGAAWSPNGTTLASEVGGRLQLRRLGVGSPVRTTRLGTRFEWLTNTRIRVQTENGWRGYDVARRRPVALPAAAARPLSVASPNGQKFAFIRWASHAASLVLGTHVVATVATCSDDLPFLAVGFVPRTSTVVYQSGCPLPSADLYSIAPDGTARQRLTATPQHEFDPALSPDGSRVAFDQQAIADRCEGCAQSLWVTPATQLTFPKDIDPAPFDADPSWSPDGSTLVFDRSGADAPLELYTIAAAGGTAKDLHVAGIHPAWGPALIAFLPWNAKTPAIETLDPATGAVRTVASGKNMNVGALAWSLDGRLAYLGYAANNHAHITVAGSQAKPIDLTALLRNGGRIVDLAWSPDGGRFAFSASDANGIAEIYTIRVDGTGLTQVTKDAGVDVFDGGISWR